MPRERVNKNITCILKEQLQIRQMIESFDMMYCIVMFDWKNKIWFDQLSDKYFYESKWFNDLI